MMIVFFSTTVGFSTTVFSMTTGFSMTVFFDNDRLFDRGRTSIHSDVAAAEVNETSAIDKISSALRIQEISSVCFRRSGVDTVAQARIYGV
jgi:hypothetical protein